MAIVHSADRGDGWKIERLVQHIRSLDGNTDAPAQAMAARKRRRRVETTRSESVVFSPQRCSTPIQPT
ncbi:hypothetical protein GCM10027413_29740 [Conyzicola nivalis]|uniref:Uncharacterized protein n=1 Tax=Conyzicola nivalis TaxID=1477021 RepID=A0A916SS24_9MICO|nr:hypothetical protein GCM10010979_29770 [Conyzicola nivalis]